VTRNLTGLALVAFGCLLHVDAVHSAGNDDDRLQLLKAMGAEGRFVMPTRDQQDDIYQRFDKQDVDQNGVLSATEFIDQNDGFTPDIRDRLFAAADLDHDKSLTHDEFAEHVVVAGEAQAIFSNIDADGDGIVIPQEFAQHSQIGERDAADLAFSRFDTNKNGSLNFHEFLATFSEWTRLEQPPVTARLIAKQKTYKLAKQHQTEAFRKQIELETDIDRLPPVPKVNLVLVIQNVSNEPVIVWPRGSVDEATVMVEGDGLVRPENLQGAGGAGTGTTPQPVIQPGKTFRIPVRSLNPLENFLDNVYWTKPGEYRISASYPVYQNLPPHLPELFPNQPKPTGKPKRFHVTAPPVPVQVVAE